MTISKDDSEIPAPPASEMGGVDESVEDFGDGKVKFGDARLPSRFWRKTKLDPNGCWLWLGAVGSSGYGMFQFIRGSKKIECVHRGVFRTFVKEIPVGYDVCHHCDNRICFNPAHLFTDTRLGNIHDGMRKHRAGNTRLTIEEIKEIKRQLATIRHCAPRLAREYGVTKQTIYSIAKGETWATI